MTTRIRGPLAPVLTPFNRNLEPDAKRFIGHCKWLVDNDAGLAIFGTNSEAASLSVAERLSLTDQLLEAGLPASKMMPGTGACSITDAVTLTKHAVRNGAAGVLVLPPFFFKNVSDDGIFAYYAEIIERVADDRLAIYLYHIPQFTYAPITLNVIERLLARYPKAIAGAKDSSGDWNNSKAMIDAFASTGFDVFPASESLLTKALPIGGAGCISATVNMNPKGIRELYEGWNTPQGPELQAKADAVRKVFQGGYMIPAMKHAIAECTVDPEWKTVRPPLCPMPTDAANALLEQLREIRFSMPGYPKN